MLSFIKSLFQSQPSNAGMVALQPPGEFFPWPRGARLIALEPVTLAIPSAAIAENEKIGSVIFGDADMEIRLPATPSDTLIFLRLKEGSTVSLSKSVQSVVVADDNRPRRIRVLPPPDENPPDKRASQ